MQLLWSGVVLRLRGEGGGRRWRPLRLPSRLLFQFPPLQTIRHLLVHIQSNG